MREAGSRPATDRRGRVPDDSLTRSVQQKILHIEKKTSGDGPKSSEDKFMRYMLLVYLEENALSETERQVCYRDSAKLARDLSATGQYIDASPLELTPAATSVRVRNGKRLVTDGPFAETREQLGGYYLINANDLDEAISIASRVPVVRMGTVEIRPVMEIQGLPADGQHVGSNTGLSKT